MNKITAIQMIRLLSGMFPPEEAVDRLALVNLLGRYVLGDAEYDFVNSQIEPFGYWLIPGNYSFEKWESKEDGKEA